MTLEKVTDIFFLLNDPHHRRLKNISVSFIDRERCEPDIYGVR